MINEPFEPISEPRACGWPYHGFYFEKQISGVKTTGLIVNGVEGPTPAAFNSSPQGSRVAHKIRHPNAPLLDLSAEEIASEAEAQRSWRNYATVSGARNFFYGEYLGWRSWIAVLDDGKAWLVSIIPSQIGQRWRWIMTFFRYSYGPAYLSGMSGTPHNFWVELAADSALSAFEPTSAAADRGMRIYDLSTQGDRMITIGTDAGLVGHAMFTVRVIKSSDLTPFGLTLETASGELPFVFDCIENHDAPVFDSPVNSFPVVKKDSMVDYALNYDEATQAILPAAARTIYPSSTVRVYATHPNWLTAYVDYKLFDVPPMTVTSHYKLTRKAHLPDDGGDGFVMYIDETTYTATRTASGQFCGIGAIGNGSANPEAQNYCVPPSTCTGTIQHTVTQTIRYAGKKYTGTSSWVTTATNLNINAQGNPSYPVLNSLNGFAVELGLVEVESNFAPYAQFFKPRESVLTDDQYAADLTFWNMQYWDGNSETVQSLPTFVQSPVDANFTSPVMYCPDQSALPGAHFRPAASAIPKGIYYKGKFIKPWLPAYNVVWSVDPETYEVCVLPRAPTYDGDGYTYCCYV